MRVAMIGGGALSIPPVGWGATERVIWNLQRQSARAGFESVIVNARWGPELVAECRRLRPDVIHLHAYRRVGDCLRYLLDCPTPLVVTSHDPRLNRYVPPGVREAITLADAVIALNPGIEPQFAAAGATTVYYIQNGVDTDLFRPLAKKPGTVLGVGKNTARKRFVDVASFFLQHPEYQLTLCGPEVKIHRARSRPVIPTGPNIVLLEHQPEAGVARLMGEAEFFVHLSAQEASALVVREAMACGCRVWTTEANAADLTNVALSWEQAVADRELGVRAAHEARERLDWSVVAREHARVYAQTLERWRTSPLAAEQALRRYRKLAAERAQPAARVREWRDWIRRYGVRRGLSRLLARGWSWGRS